MFFYILLNFNSKCGKAFGIQCFRELFIFSHGDNILHVELKNMAELPVLQLEKR